MITVAITTFNRGDIVEKSLRSAFSFAETAACRVVLVDDGSTDGTDSKIKQLFADQLASGLLTFVRLDQNRGVSAAKNTAFDRAERGWVVFLDSDDELIPHTGQPVRQCLDSRATTPVVFFRCMNEKNAFVGTSFEEPREIDLRDYIAHTSYGEALVVINKPQIDASPPFDGDLRGYEGLGCVKLIKKYGPALLSTIVARRYNRSRRDRLSSPAGFIRRAHLLAIGHLRYIAVCGEDMAPHQRAALRLKAAVYWILGRLYALFRTHD